MLAQSRVILRLKVECMLLAGNARLKTFLIAKYNIIIFYYYCSRSQFCVFVSRQSLFISCYCIALALKSNFCTKIVNCIFWICCTKLKYLNATQVVPEYVVSNISSVF